VVFDDADGSLQFVQISGLVSMVADIGINFGWNMVPWSAKWEERGMKYSSIK
jgi:hypothetical protein